jgi:putative inorganic carbon (HCO3(-)) transporter
MRTIALTMMLLVLVPLALIKPWTGVLTWTWISIMNPHKLTFGFLQDFPVGYAVAIATLLGAVFTRDHRKWPVTPVTITLAVFVLWICITSIFAVYPAQSGEQFTKVMKIQLMIFVTLLLLHDRKHIELFVWVIVISLGFYGIKGGIFTLLHGGQGTVSGPPGGFIAPNNELALALTMTVPLMFYLRESPKPWLRWGFTGAILLTALSILGSQSRGALLAIIAMAIYLWRHSKKKWVFGVAIILIGASLIAFMPSRWEDRMSTIAEYQDDSSARGRLNAWAMSFNLAKDRFLGGGFEVITPEMFARYAPDPLNLHAAHSIYFQILGEHGFVGLGIFLLFWALTWRTATWVIKNAGAAEMSWAGRLASMVQVSLAGYFVGGAFLSLAYFDLPYDLMVIVVLCRVLIGARLKGAAKHAVPRGEAARIAP